VFSREDVKKNEDFILNKYQTPLKSKHYIICLTETRVCIVLGLSMA